MGCLCGVFDSTSLIHRILLINFVFVFILFLKIFIPDYIYILSDKILQYIEIIWVFICECKETYKE